MTPCTDGQPAQSCDSLQKMQVALFIDVYSSTTSIASWLRMGMRFQCQVHRVHPLRDEPGAPLTHQLIGPVDMESLTKALENTFDSGYSLTPN